MPELPEVETVVRDLRRAGVVGRTLSSVEVRWPGCVAAPGAETFRRRLTGARIAGVRRRGKYVVMELAGAGAALAHLRMSGRLFVRDGAAVADPHDRLALRLDDGRSLVFHDPRKFGRWMWCSDPRRALAGLGPEPLSAGLTRARWRGLLRGRRRRVKPLLLDQSFLAGVGNIYADEALWRARVHPARPAHGLSGAEGDRLRESLRCTLRRAIRLGGTSLGHGETNFRGAGLRPGRNQLRLAAYGRAGKACPRCGTVIEKMVLAQRGTHFCPRCQPAARGRAHAGAGRTR